MREGAGAAASGIRREGKQEPVQQAEVVANSILALELNKLSIGIGSGIY